MSEPRKIKFIPKVCTDHEEEEDVKGKKKVVQVKATFKGHVFLRPATFDERYEILEKTQLEFDSEGGVVVKKGSNPFGMIRTLVDASKKFYQEVDLERIADGKKFKSFDELSEDGGCDKIIVEIANATKTSFAPGKS